MCDLNGCPWSFGLHPKAGMDLDFGSNETENFRNAFGVNWNAEMLDSSDERCLYIAETLLKHSSFCTTFISIYWAMFSQTQFSPGIKTQKHFTARLIRSFYEVCVLLLTQAFIRITFFKREEG